MDSSVLALSLTLIGTGILVLLADFFVPSGGILSALGLVAVLLGVGLPFYYGDSSTGMYTLVGTAIVLPALLGLMFHYWPKTPMGRRLFQTGSEEDATIASMPVIAELEMLRGRVGRAVSPLRPSGVADFEGRRIDVLTEGLMVEEGTWVRCIDVKVGKVIVRPIDEPKLSDLENADFK
jgi:membrane-bound serine protease (ClpP class)